MELSKQLKEKICEALLKKKAKDLTVIDIAGKTIIADYFVIASGHSSTQVKAIAEGVDEIMSKEEGIEPLRREGLREGRWVVLDYGGVIVHIFNDEARDFYCLERLWTDGANIEKIKE